MTIKRGRIGTVPKTRREIAREVDEVLRSGPPARGGKVSIESTGSSTRAAVQRSTWRASHAAKPLHLTPDLAAALVAMAEEAESDAGENLYLGRHTLGYTGDPKEFRFSQIFGRRLPGEKYDRLVEIITEFRRQTHDRLGRPLTDREADRLKQEARKIRDEEIAHLNRVTSADR